MSNNNNRKLFGRDSGKDLSVHRNTSKYDIHQVPNARNFSIPFNGSLPNIDRDAQGFFIAPPSAFKSLDMTTPISSPNGTMRIISSPLPGTLSPESTGCISPSVSSFNQAFQMPRAAPLPPTPRQTPHTSASSESVRPGTMNSEELSSIFEESDEEHHAPNGRRGSSAKIKSSFKDSFNKKKKFGSGSGQGEQGTK